MQEFDLIQQYFLPLVNNKNADNLQNDVAKISVPKGFQLVVSKDMMVENVHFLRQDGGYKIASKLLLTNLSDLAASGAKPLYYMLGFSKNKNLDQNFFQQFVLALTDLQKKFNLNLIGGDTVSADSLVFSITIFGITKNILHRNKAQEQDLIFVSGNIGDAGLGLILSKQNKQTLPIYAKNLLQAHFFPTPQIDLGLKLSKSKLSNTAIDVSDGLLADLQHICTNSDLDAHIFFDKIPISASAKQFLANNPQHNVLNLLASGDDYQLIFAVKPKNKQKIIDLLKKIQLNCSCIGSFIAKSQTKPQVLLFDNNAINAKQIFYQKTGYQH
jgi:thiamine-monophosphate kinase